jgi:ribosomal protein L21E
MNRKFQIGDNVGIIYTKAKMANKYLKWYGIKGTVVGYQIRKFEGLSQGSFYKVKFNTGGAQNKSVIRSIETEYLKHWKS